MSPQAPSSSSSSSFCRGARGDGCTVHRPNRATPTPRALQPPHGSPAEVARGVYCRGSPTCQYGPRRPQVIPDNLKAWGEADFCPTDYQGIHQRHPRPSSSSSSFSSSSSSLLLLPPPPTLSPSPSPSPYLSLGLSLSLSVTLTLTLTLALTSTLTFTFTITKNI